LRYVYNSMLQKKHFGIHKYNKKYVIYILVWKLPYVPPPKPPLSYPL